jgi:hypothetical protein
MASTPARAGRSRRPKPDRRRALELLADCGHEGCTEAVMLANGITIEQMVEMVRFGWRPQRRSKSAPAGR